MKTLIIVMGILSLFTSCSGRKEKLVKKEGSALNEFEVEKSKFYLDADTLGNIVSFNKGNDTGKSSVSCPLKPSDSAPLC